MLKRVSILVCILLVLFLFVGCKPEVTKQKTLQDYVNEYNNKEIRQGWEEHLLGGNKSE